MKARKQNIKQGAGNNQFGVKIGELRKFAKKIKAELHQKWLLSNDSIFALSELSLSAERIAKSQDGSDFQALLDGLILKSGFRK